MNTKHTPGPWKAEGTHSTEIVIDCPKEGKVIAFMSIAGDGKQNEANAKLISAAPELLEALIAYVDDLLHETEVEKWYQAHKSDKSANQVLINAIAAIKKASE